AHGVERADPDPGGLGAEQPPYPLAHFAGRLVGERDGQERGGIHAVLQDQVGDADREHARLARARPREDEQRPVHVLDRFPLLWIEIVQITHRPLQYPAGAVALRRSLRSPFRAPRQRRHHPPSRARTRPRRAALPAGRSISKTVPARRRGRAAIRPPWTLTMIRRTNESPTPQPPALLVTPGSKIRSRR